jgi:hypothetical protein
MNPEETKAYKAIVAYIEKNIEHINAIPKIVSANELPGTKITQINYRVKELQKRLGDINPALTQQQAWLKAVKDGEPLPKEVKTTLTQQQAWLTAVKNGEPLPEEAKTTLLTAIEAQSGILTGDINTLETEIEVLNTGITGLKSKEQTPFNITLITRQEEERDRKTKSLDHKEKERTLLSQCTQYITNPPTKKTIWQRIRSFFSRAISVLFNTPNQQDPVGKSFNGTSNCPASDSLRTIRTSKAKIYPSKEQHEAPKTTPGNPIK